MDASSDNQMAVGRQPGERHTRTVDKSDSVMARSPVKSAARALEVLELFNETREPLRLNYVAHRLNYPQSSTTALLKSLVTLGYLNYDRVSRTYFPTTRVSSLGDWICYYVFDEGRLLDMMREIHEQTGETVAIVARNDLYVQYLRVIDSIHPLRFHTPEGSMRYLTQSSAGLVLLSRMNDEAVEKIWRHINIQMNAPSTGAQLTHLLAQLDEIRRNGFSFLCGMPLKDAATISASLPNGPHGIPLAIGVGGLNHRIVRQKSTIQRILVEAIEKYAAAGI